MRLSYADKYSFLKAREETSFLFITLFLKQGVISLSLEGNAADERGSQAPDSDYLFELSNSLTL